MQKQSAYVREMFAVKETVSKFRHYLVGHKFIIRTDQEALKCMCQQTIHTPEQQKWLPKLLDYDFFLSSTNLVEKIFQQMHYQGVMYWLYHP